MTEFAVRQELIDLKSFFVKEEAKRKIIEGLLKSIKKMYLSNEVVEISKIGGWQKFELFLAYAKEGKTKFDQENVRGVSSNYNLVTAYRVVQQIADELEIEYEDLINFMIEVCQNILSDKKLDREKLKKVYEIFAQIEKMF